MVYIKRDLEKKVIENLDRPEIIAVLGPRQSGKTTLLRHIFDSLENAVFLSFEDRETLELFVEDEKAFADLYAKKFRYLFIDEFQYAKEGGKKLKYLYDTYPETKIIISGSSAPGLAIHSIKHLVGRIFVFNLYPLSFGEFLGYKDDSLFAVYLEKKEAIKAHLFGKTRLPAVSEAVMKRINRLYKEYVIYGGYPRVATSKNEGEKQEVLKSIYSTYFLWEIKDLLSLTTDFSLARLIKALSIQTGGMISYNSLCEASGFDYKGLLTHLNILEKTFICRKVTPFFANRRTELVKSPKIYFYDNGLRNAVIGDFRPFESRQDIGQLNENFIFSQLTYMGAEVKYWRSKSKAEVDFIVDREGKLMAVESKSTVGRSKSLASFREKYRPYKALIACTEKLEDIGGTLHMPFAFISSLQ